jgi:ribonucleoside-diphosphate reductase alpha chain
MFQQYWCEHNPSITIYYKDSEFLSLGQSVYNEFDKIAGVSFLPHSDHKYPQAPYEEITEEQYDMMVSTFPSVNWEVFKQYEKEDNTTSAKELACSAGVCEI